MSASPPRSRPLRRNAPDEIRAPGAWLMLLEARAPLEYAALVAAWPWLGRLPRGDGHPVMVFPGMGANDLTTLPLRRLLRRLGYVTRAWGQGLNFGPRKGVLARCADDIRRLADGHGQPVSLIGWSLGGLYAREMAKELPALARCVITLGTPFSGPPRATNAWRLYELLSGQRSHDPVLHRRLRVPPACPTTSIYSRTDGVVAWRCSLNPPAALTENIEVKASHVGMGMHPAALVAVADRLAQPIGAWRPFEASGMRRWWYPAPPPPAADGAA